MQLKSSKDTQNLSKKISKYLEKISMLQKLLAPSLGGLYFYVFNKKTIPITPVKLKFKVSSALENISFTREYVS